MALPGMKSTADFATDERPKNYREGIMLLEPRNGAALYRLTAAMRSESTDDPEFDWWNEQQNMYTFQINGALLAAATTVVVDAGALRLKPGDMLRVETTGEMIRVVSITTDTSFTVTRAVGPGGSAAGTAAGIADDAKLLYVGSAYREGAPRSVGVSTNPTKGYNYTQIFRDPVEWTRTALATRFRTGKPQSNDKRRALHKHALGIERAFWLGTRYETLESGQPLRFTGGLLDFIPAANVKTVVDGGGLLDMDEFESYFASMFAYGSGEKLAFTSLAVMMAIITMIRKNSSYQWQTGDKEYGMAVTRLVSPAGTLVLTEHPAFGQSGAFMQDSMVVLDTTNLVYRYIQDTTYLQNREDNGTDGKTDEYLTEAGLEVHNPETFFWLKGIKGGKADD
jgi:hypothetical protein